MFRRFVRRLFTETYRFKDELNSDNASREKHHAYVSIGVRAYSKSPTRAYARVDGVLGFAAAPGGWKASVLFRIKHQREKYLTIDFSTSTFREKRKAIEQYSKKIRCLEAIDE